MIAPNKAHRVLELLREGKLTQRSIADELGMSRSTVSSIATGRRAVQRSADEPRAEYVRCPGCGGKVLMPCRVCNVRSLNATHA